MMIAMIEGVVKDLSATSACIMTVCGVGYDIELTTSDICTLEIGQSVSLWTHLLVREEAHLLCGFLHKADRHTFKTLIKVSGVGAKMALSILSVLPQDKLACAIEQGDEMALTRVAGVGKKTAQRLILELKGKLHSSSMPIGVNVFVDEVLLALLSLGYKEKEAKDALALCQNAQSTQQLLKSALGILSRF